MLAVEVRVRVPESKLAACRTHRPPRVDLADLALDDSGE
jgi:hypothetical protein